MSTRVPNRYAEALRPDSAFTYCGPLSVKSRYAVASSRGVNVSRALGLTTTLIALHRLLRTGPPSIAVWSRYQHPAGAARGLRVCHEVGAKKGYGGFFFLPHGPYSPRSCDLDAQPRPYSGDPDKNT